MKALAVVVAVVSLVAPARARAAFEPQNLHVVGGEETWHAERSFELRWTNPPGVTAVHYRVIAPAGQEVAGGTLGWPASAIEYLNVPAVPGVYGAQVWLEDTGGQSGPAASAQLRFDDTAPGRIEVGPVPDWIGRSAFPLAIDLDPPQGTEPLSGVRGYAFSVDRDPVGAPCATAARCTEAETDLRGGVGAVAIPALPEGTSYLHAAAVSGSGVESPTATVALRVDATDPVTALFGARGGWSNRPVELLASAIDLASGMNAGAGIPFTAIRVDDGVPVTAPGETASTTVIGSGIHRVAYYARDAAGNVADGATVNGHRDAEPATVVVRIDRQPPQVAFAAAQDPRDPERIEAIVADSLSGVEPSRGAIAVRPAGSPQPFIALPSEAHRDRLQAHWNSVAHPPGLYEFRATAYDLAGNSAFTSLRSNGSRMVLRSPLKIPTALSARLNPSGAPYPSIGREKRTGRAWTVPFGRPVYLAGRLIAGRHSPLAGRLIHVVERFDSGGERISTVRTDGDGRFSLRLRPGPSREVVATAAPTATLARASSRPARLEVTGRVGLQASASVATVGGRPVVFSGRVGATPIPHGGKTVELQFRLPGLPWSEFRTTTTDERGRFRYAYRFADDDSRGVRFQFRAVAPTQNGWPYEPAASRSVSVRGR